MNHRSGYNPNINVYGTYPRKMSDFDMMQQSATLDEYNFTPDPQQLRGILRKNREQYPSHPSMFLNSFEYNAQPEPKYVVKQPKTETKWNAFFHKILQPCVAEFIAICISTFIWKHVDAQLSERQVNFFTRVLLLSALDAASVGVFLSAFETVQLNPAITIAQLFSMNTPWYMCIFLILIQFFGAFTGIILFNFVHTGIVPNLPALVIDINGDFTSSVFELIICQFIGNFIVCISFLIVTRPVGTTRLYIARLFGNPFCVVSGVALSSFLSLLHSNIAWNPVTALALSSFHYLKGGGASMPWHNHYIFWLGPIIGSLTSCFIFRFILAPIERRLQMCSNNTPSYSIC